jgi:hypothetical protein
MTTNVYLKTKIDERTSQAAVLAGLQDTAAREARDLTEQERKTFDGIVSRLTFLDQEIKRITEAEQGAADFVKIYGAHREAAAADAAARAAAAASRGTEERSRLITWGEAFTRSQQFLDYQKNRHGSSAAFEISGDWLGGNDWVEERTNGGLTVPNLPGEAGSFATEWGVNFPVGTNVMAAGWGDNAPRQTWAGPRQPDERFPLMAVIGRVPTTMGSVEFYYWFPGTDKMASEVPEGELKPEAELGGELKAMPVATYAWWKGITRQALDDIPMIRSVVDGFLRRGVIRRINGEAVNALLTDTHIPAIGAAGQSLLALIRLGIAQVDDQGYSANAVILNPFDWAAFDVALMEGQGATAMQRVFWGLTPVPLQGVPSGTCYVGDFREGVTFFDRQQTSVFATDSHADYFLRNKLVILAEARGRVAVTNAAAMVKATGTVPPMVIGDGDDDGEGITGQSAVARHAVQERPRRERPQA